MVFMIRWLRLCRIWTRRTYDLVQSNFKSVVTLSMETADGREALQAVVSADDWLPKLFSLNRNPPVLRLVGYTCDAVLWNISESPTEKVAVAHKAMEEFRNLLNRHEHINTKWVWTNHARTVLYTPLIGRGGGRENIEQDLCRIADGLCDPSGGIPSSPLRKEYHFRVIMLGCTNDELEFMVLSRSGGDSQLPEKYERVNTIQRENTLPEFPYSRVSRAVQDGSLESWKLIETVIV